MKRSREEAEYINPKRPHLARLLTYYDIARNHLGELADTLPFARLTANPALDAILASLQRQPKAVAETEELRLSNGTVCKGCRELFAHSEIRMSYCRTCLNDRRKRHCETPRGYLLQLIDHCRQADKRAGRNSI